MTDSMPLHLLSASEAGVALGAKRCQSVDLVKATLARIAKYDRTIRAFAEVFEQTALREAERADQRRARGESLGPLDGIPVTIKESIEMQDCSSTLGIPSRMSHRASHDAAIVTAMRETGAVIVGRTNIAQALLSFECRNPLYGQCVNPRKLTHSPGGSSGGEAAALAYGASMLGIGTDIGGSIRLPAHFSGIVGFKPTQDRWPTRGMATVLVGQEGVRSQSGPMARSVDDIWLALRTLRPERLTELDARVPPVPWRDIAEISVKNLRIAVLRTPVILAASTSLWRGVELAAETLRAQGAIVIDWSYDGLDGMVQDFMSAVSADGGALLRAALEGGSVDVTLRSMVQVAKLSPGLRHAVQKIAQSVGQQNTAAMLGSLGERTVGEYWKLIALLRKRRMAFEQAIRGENIDIILSPPCATPAVSHGDGAQFAQAAAYTILFNVTHGPAGVVPVTTVRADETVRDWSGDMVLRRAAKVDRESVGLPVGVQVASVAWRDEEVLAVLRAIERGVANDPEKPQTVIDP